MQEPGAAPLAIVVGPTGSGKSELALRLARTFSGEVVNCDSLQIYRYLDIGTAKLLPESRRGIPHHLIDILDPNQVFTAGEYARLARPVLQEISARGRLPIVVGGTGFYLSALLEGLFPGPARQEQLRLRLAHREKRYPGWLHRTLARFDPESARRIHAQDTQKLIRAVEVLLTTRRPLSSWFVEGRDPLTGFRPLKLGIDPPREALYRRLDERCAQMFEHGLIEEVRGILARGYPLSSKALESHGYKQALQMLAGELKPGEAIFYAQRNTRRYAKRQWTWFRRDPGVVWLRGFGEEDAVERAAAERIRAFLGVSPVV